MINRIEIANFKSIQHSAMDLKPLTIFTGPNSSGKSNILEGIAILAQISRLSGDITRSLAGSLGYGELLKYPHPYYDFIAHKKDLDKRILFDVQIETRKYEVSEILETIKKQPSLSKYVTMPITSVGFAYSYLPRTEEVSQSLFIDGKKLVEIAVIRTDGMRYDFIHPKEFQDLNLGLGRFPGEVLHSECFDFRIPPSIKDASIIDTIKGLSSVSKEIVGIIDDRFSRVYLISTARGLVEPEVKTGVTPSWVGKHGEHLIEMLSLIFSKWEHEAKAEKISNWAKKFGIGRIKAGWWGKDTLGSDYEDPVLKAVLNMALSSYGSRQLLTMITQIFWSEPGDLIMIEEPEISLHPGSQVLLQELFAEAIKEGKQIICSTHSPFLVLALSRVVRDRKISTDDVAVYHVEKTEQGTKVKLLELNERGFIKGWIPSYIKIEDELFREWAESLEK